MGIITVRKTTFATGLAAVSILVSACGATGASTARARPSPVFGANSAAVTNPYLPISKFHRCNLAGNDTGQHLRVVRTLRHRTKSIAYRGRKVKTAVVRDQVTNLRTGRLIERTIDYFAQDRAGNAYYFGEDVNEYSSGKLVGHSGSWRVGRHGAGPGILMPALPKVGDTFFSENISGVAVEKDRVVASGLTRKFGGHTYRHVIRIREHATTPKPAEFEFKTYAPGTGVITEANGGLRLVGCSRA
jgi:hypothetical protein